MLDQALFAYNPTGPYFISFHLNNHVPILGIRLKIR